MSGFLRELAQSSLERLTQARSSKASRRCGCARRKRRRRRACSSPTVVSIASPSSSCARPRPVCSARRARTLAARVTAYAQGGAAAISVLTEPYRFDGSMAHLARASQVLAPLGVPTMRKDFLIDPYQVMEARALGAGGVLVILRMLDHGRMVELLDCAAMLHMFVLLEAFDERDIELRQPAGRRARAARRATAGRHQQPRSRHAPGRSRPARQPRRKADTQSAARRGKRCCNAGRRGRDGSCRLPDRTGGQRLDDQQRSQGAARRTARSRAGEVVSSHARRLEDSLCSSRSAA